MRELRPGWKLTKVGDLFDMQLGKMLSKEAARGPYQREYLTNKNVQWNRLKFDELNYMSFSESERGWFRLRRGDLLVTEGGEVGRTALWDGERDECYFQKSLHRLRSKGSMDPRYMLHYMNYAARWKLFIDAVGQTSIAHLPQDKLAEHRVAHPVDLAEQRRIADVLEAVSAQERAVEASIEKLRSIRAGILLSAAAKISESQTGFDHGRTLGSRLLRIEAGRSPDLPDLPAAPGTWGVLKVSAVHTEGFRPRENKVISSAMVNPRYEVRPGDLLMSRANTPELVGSACIATESEAHLLLSDKTLRLVVDPNLADVRYVNACLSMPSVRAQIGSNSSGSSLSMQNISQRSVEKLAIPWPELAEQRRIADEIDACDALVSDELKQLDKLKQVGKGLADDLLRGASGTSCGSVVTPCDSNLRTDHARGAE